MEAGRLPVRAAWASPHVTAVPAVGDLENVVCLPEAASIFPVLSPLASFVSLTVFRLFRSRWSKP